MLNRIHQTFVSIVWTSGSLIDMLPFVLICFSKRTFYTNVTDPQSFRHETLLILALENNWEGTGKSKRTFYTNVTDPQSFRHEPLLLLALENNWEGTGKELGRNWEGTGKELGRN